MKKLLFAAILFTVAGFVKAQTPSLKDGIQHLQNENFKAALNTFTAIARNDPKNGTIYYYIGEVSYRTEDFTEAEKAYKKGLIINSRCAECKIGLGKLALDKGKTMEADEYFESAAKLDKKNPEVFALIGEAYLYNKKPNAKKAVEYLTMAKAMDPSVAKYWAHLGDAYRMQNNNGEAMTSYETALVKDPNNTSAYISMAKIWAAAKLYDNAIKDLLKAIELSPEDALPYKDLIELYIRTGKYDSVTPLLEKYISLTGTDVDAKVRLVKFLTFQAKDYERAIAEGEKLLQTNPEQYTLHRWLAWAYGESGDYKKSHYHSKRLFEEIGKKEERVAFPSDYDFWARAAFHMDSLDEAAHVYRKYLELDPSRSQEIYGLLAKAYFDAKNYEQAIAYYKRKGAEAPLSIADEYYLALAYFYTNKNLESDSSFARVLELTPDYLPAWMMRARIANRLDPDAANFTAKPFYEKYILIGESDPAKNRDNLIEAYKYMGYYYAQVDSLDLAKMQFEKIINLDSTNLAAIETLKLLKGQN